MINKKNLNKKYYKIIAAEDKQMLQININRFLSLIFLLNTL